MTGYCKVQAIGNLTRDPELKYLESGTAVANFSIAINESYTDKNSGEKKESVCFVEVEAWGRHGEVVNEYLSKGSRIFIEGTLKFEQWEEQGGAKRSRHKIRLMQMRFLDKKEDSGGYNSAPQQQVATPPVTTPTSDAGAAPPPDAQTEDDIPF